MIKIAYFLLALLPLVLPALEFSGIFRDNMVLQRDLKLPVWGKGTPGEDVVVTLGTETLAAKVRADGEWRVDFAPRPASDQPVVLSANAPSGAVKINNVLVGDVYLCGGQSNMEWWVVNSTGAEDAVKNAENKRIRLFFPDRAIAVAPQESAKGRWYLCNPANVPKFSAIGYYFGREMERELGIPIGLINVSRGASSIEAWMSREALEALDEGRAALAWYERESADYDRKYREYQENLAAFNAKYKSNQELTAAQAEARKAGLPIPIRPFVPLGPEHPHCVSGLYNAQIAPLGPFALKGAIFYQGEANVERAKEYVPLLRAMLADWRRTFENPQMLFGIVQLPNYGKTFADCRENQWANLRAAQAEALQNDDFAALTVTIDLGNPADLHPKNKYPVGRRLAEQQLGRFYGKNFPVSSPTVKAVEFTGGAAKVTFNFAEKLSTRDGKLPRAFQLAGADGKFYRAEAELADNVVVVRSAKVPEPVKLRYAWEYSPDVNLVNEHQLPAMPFQQ